MRGAKPDASVTIEHGGPVLDRRSIVSFGTSWSRRGTFTTAGSEMADQLMLIEVGSVGLAGRVVSGGALIVTPAGSSEEITTESWSVTSFDLCLERSSTAPLAAEILNTLSWHRSSNGEWLTLDGSSMFLLAVLSGVVTVTLDGRHERASRELLVISPASDLTRVEPVGSAEMLTVELAPGATFGGA